MRRTWLLELTQIAFWQLKVYAISASGEDLPSEVYPAALAHVRNELRERPLLLSDTPKQPHSFMILHQGTEALWLLLDLCVEDILHHHTYRAALDAPTEFVSAMEHGAAACAWELEVIQHERDAWVEQVLVRPENPDLERYRAQTLDLSG